MGIEEKKTSNSLKIEKDADLLDISGRKVLKLKAGINNLSFLKSGIYFIKYRNRNFKKLLIIH
uniref:T9SS type A sorting domain-containing protein n=1 Tax=candidate division WOR-3 bacterium TaxID=2052148 RepID=A0A7V5XZL0_UNCW3